MNADEAGKIADKYNEENNSVDSIILIIIAAANQGEKETTFDALMECQVRRLEKMGYFVMMVQPDADWIYKVSW